jgi:SAM-dependent methyltransferase
MRPELYDEMAAVQERHWWFAARRRILSTVINTLALPMQPDILEIGCGTGGNLAMLASFGNLCAVEYNDGARRLAERLCVCPVLTGGLPGSMPFDNHRFDLICLLDVLEHIADDGAALGHAARLLKPSGRVLVTVPAYAWLWSAHDDVHHHYRRYTAGMLSRLAMASGLTIFRLGYFNTLLFPMIATARLAGKLTGRDTRSDASLPPTWLNALLTGMFGLERHIVRKTLFPFGASVMAVLTAKR